MLLFNNEGNLNGLPPGGKGADAGAGAGAGEQLTDAVKSKVAAEAAKVLLPQKDGEKVLYAKEVLPPSLAKLMTPAAFDAIPKVALAKYLVGMVPLVAKDKTKATFQLVNFVARLRVWPLLNKIYLLASSEQRPYNPKTNSDVVMDEVKSLVLAASAMLPKDDVQTGDQTHKDVLAMIDLVQQVGAAQVALWAAQISTVVGFELSEWNFGTNATSAKWGGPVAVASRVAKVNEKGVKVYPVPNVWRWVGEAPFGKTPNNPAVGGTTNAIPGLADYTPFNGYIYGGADPCSGKFFLEKRPLNPLGAWVPEAFSGNFAAYVGLVNKNAPDIGLVQDKYLQANLVQDAAAVLNDQMLREFSSLDSAVKAGSASVWYDAPSVKSILYKPAPNKLPPATNDGLVHFGNPITLGDFAVIGLDADPEWTSPGNEDRRTPQQVMESILPAIRAAHDKARVALKTPWNVGATSAGAYALYMDALAKLKSTIVKVCYVVPTEWKWEGDLLLQPTAPNWEKWLSDVSIEDPLKNNLYKLIEKNYKFFMKLKPDAEILSGLYGIVVALLQDAASEEPKQPFGQWNPLVAKELPPPFFPSYKLDVLLATATPPAQAAANGAIAGFTSDQTVIVGTRSGMKAATLLAMKATEFGQESQELTDSILGTMFDLFAKLYGCAPTPWPPEEAKKLEELVDFYKAQLEACGKTPAAGSLVAQLAALLAQYTDLKTKADAGDAEAANKLDDLAEQISTLQAKIASLVGAIASLLKDVADNSVESGGTLDWVKISETILSGIKGEVKLSGGKADVGQTPEEEQAQKDAKDQNAKTKKAAIQSLAVVKALSDTLLKLVKDLHVPVADVVTQDLETTGKVADLYVPKPETKQSNFWLWLLLGGAVAYSQSKK